jgi:hypothetical protein
LAKAAGLARLSRLVESARFRVEVGDVFKDRASHGGAADAGRDGERRRHGRLRTEMAGELVTALGPVLDLSLSGMRVRTKDPCPVYEGLRCRLEMRCGETSAELPVEVVRLSWEKRGAWVVGIRFRTLSAAQTRKLGMLARLAVTTADPTRPRR